jgi:hypothetical protein
MDTILSLDGLAVKENDRYNGRFLPQKLNFLGSVVSPKGGRAGIDSITFRFRAGYKDSDNLIDSDFYRKNSRSGKYEFFQTRLDDDNIRIEYHQNNGGEYFDVFVPSLTKFYKKRSSAIFKNWRDYVACLYQLKDAVNAALPVMANRFDPFECEIVRHDQFVDLIFERRDGELETWYEKAKRSKIAGLPYIYEYEKNGDDRATFGWMNLATKETSTEFLKMYFKRSREKNRDKREELNRYKMRVEHTIQNRHLLRELLETELGISPQDSYHLPHPTNRRIAYGVPNQYLNNAFNLCRPETINRLFWLRAQHLFATAQLV